MVQHQNSRLFKPKMKSKSAKAMEIPTVHHANPKKFSTPTSTLTKYLSNESATAILARSKLFLHLSA